jgi:CheY-like chemotaxis protein
VLAALKKRRALLLDDDPSMQRLVSTLLRRAGYRVEVFQSGRDAIEAIRDDAYDILLLDLMMPVEGGMTVIRHLRKTNPKLLDRTLVLTASPESIIASVAKQVAGVVKKPFESKELIGAVKRVANA